MASRDLSVDVLGVHFQNPFCLSSSPVGNCYGMCAKAYETGWGGVVYKTLHTDDFKVNEVPPRFDELTKECTPFVGFKNMGQIAEHPLESDLAAIRCLKAEYPTASSSPRSWARTRASGRSSPAPRRPPAPTWWR